MEVKTVVRCYFKTFGDFVTIYSTDVSKEGILVKSEPPLETGDSVRLEFKLRNDYPLIMGEGQVARVGPNGASIKFVQLDADSEKFLNEVVKVKAAELKPAPGSAPVVYDAEVVHEETAEEAFEIDDAFAGIQEQTAEEIDTGSFEEIDMASPAEETGDPFSPGATEDIDFSGVSLNSRPPETEEDPFGDVAADEPVSDEPVSDEPADDIFAEQSGAADSQNEFEQDEDTSGYEDVEQTPANPQALFEDIHDSEDGAAGIPPDENTAGGSTTVFERKSVIKERRALFIGASIGLTAVLLAGGAWFFLGGTSDDLTPTQQALVDAAPVAVQAPETESVAPVTAPATVASAPATASTPSLPVAAAPAQAEPVAAKAAPVAAPAPVAVAKVSNTGPATKILDILVLGDGSVSIRGDGVFKKVKHFTMSEPNRIIVDVYGVGKAFKGLNRTGSGAIARIRPGVHEGKIRFVLDLQKETGKIPAYELSSDGDGVVVRPGL